LRTNYRILPALAMLVAVSIILTRFFGYLIPVGGANALRISFGEIPVIISGLVFGPLAGFMTGITADLLGYFINSYGMPYFPGLTLSMGLVGLIPALLLQKSSGKFGFWSLFIAITLMEIPISIFLNTYWLSIFMKAPFWALFPWRAIARLILIPIYAAVIHTIVNHSFLVSLREKRT